MKKFENKVVLITGASTGIGRATALAFAEEGATVVAVDVDDLAFAETEKLLSGTGSKFVYYHCDVGQVEEIRQMIDYVETDLGRLDYAFNNAGVEGDQAFTGVSTEDNWNRVININLRGVWACMRFEIPLLLKSGGGAIVNCSSIAGIVGFPGVPAYVASKHGVIGLTRAAALEYAQQGIRVNAVCPGVIDTPMVQRFTGGNPDVEAYLKSSEPIGRMGRPEEVADAVLWLCSEGSGFVTGHALTVDGGWVAQ